MKLAVFDYDSTLMDGETLEFIAKEFDLGEEIKNITTRAMNGELDFFESLTYRVSLLKGLSEEKVTEVCCKLPLMNGAEAAVKELQNMGFKVICFSGGFKNATSNTKKLIGLNADFSNTFHIKDGFLTGHVGGEMMFNNSKGIMLKKIQNLLGISEDDTVVIGDGANDLSMFKFARYRIAFCAKNVLRKEANIIIDEKNLALIPYKLQQML